MTVHRSLFGTESSATLPKPATLSPSEMDRRSRSPLRLRPNPYALYAVVFTGNFQTQYRSAPERIGFIQTLTSSVGIQGNIRIVHRMAQLTIGSYQETIAAANRLREAAHANPTYSGIWFRIVSE